MARAKLGEILVQQGVIDDATLKRALGAQIRFASQHLKLGQVLVDMGACKGDEVARALAQQLGFPFAGDLDDVEPRIAAALPLEISESQNALVYAHELGPPEIFRVAMADPTDLAALDALRFRLGKPVRPGIAWPDAIRAAIQRVFRGVSEEGALDLSDVLLSDEDADGPMSVEHFELGTLADFANGGGVVSEPSPTPPDEAPDLPPIEAPAPPPFVGSGDPFDDLFGTPSALPSAPPQPEVMAPLTQPAEVTRFPSKRREAQAPVSAPPTKPTLVLRSESLFGPPGAHLGALEEGPEPAAPPEDPPEKNVLAPDVPPASEPAEPPGEVLPGELWVGAPAAEAAQPTAAEAEPASDALGELPIEFDPFEAPPAEAEIEPAPVEVEAPPVSVRPAAPPTPIFGLAVPAAPPAVKEEAIAEEIDFADPIDLEPVAPAALEPGPAVEAAEKTEPLAELTGLASFADRPLTEEELAVVEAIEQLADGVITEPKIRQVQPAQMIAALVRLLIRRGIVQETEFLTELTRR